MKQFLILVLEKAFFIINIIDINVSVSNEILSSAFTLENRFIQIHFFQQKKLHDLPADIKLQKILKLQYE